MRISQDQYKCALCGATYGELPGGQAGDLPLCHRDHTEGETCYERVTRTQSLRQIRTFAETVRTLQT